MSATGEHRIIGDESELPRGSYFYVLPVPVEKGQLALIELRGDPEFIIVGRWFPNVLGYDWIFQRRRVIQCTSNVPVRVLGLVISVEDPPKQITNLREDEYEHLFEGPFPRTLNC